MKLRPPVTAGVCRATRHLRTLSRMKTILRDIVIGLALAGAVILVVLFSTFNSTFVYQGF